MVEETTGRSAVRSRESKILQGSRGRKSWQQIRMAQVLWGSKRGAFHFGRGVKRPDANFAGEVSATREGAQQKTKAPHPRTTAIFFLLQLLSLSLTNPLHNPNTVNMLIYKVRLSSIAKAAAIQAPDSSPRRARIAASFDRSTTLCVLDPRADSTPRMLSPETR